MIQGYICPLGSTQEPFFFSLLQYQDQGAFFLFQKYLIGVVPVTAQYACAVVYGVVEAPEGKGAASSDLQIRPVVDEVSSA